jgi:hypothetical protein
MQAVLKFIKLHVYATQSEDVGQLQIANRKWATQRATSVNGKRIHVTVRVLVITETSQRQTM